MKMVVIAAVVMVSILLFGCAANRDEQPTRGYDSTSAVYKKAILFYDHQLDNDTAPLFGGIQLIEVEFDTSDGYKIPCIVRDGRDGIGGLSCDWSVRDKANQVEQMNQMREIMMDMLNQQKEMNNAITAVSK